VVALADACAALLAVWKHALATGQVADIEAVQIMRLVIWSAAMVALAVWGPRIPYVPTIVKNCRGVRKDSDG
jgi:hypothetical protein